MANEPAEDRSVRGNTIKPAKVEPEQPIDQEYFVGNSGIAKSTVKDIQVDASSQVLVDTGVSNRNEVFSVQVVAENNNSVVVFQGEKSDNMDLSDPKYDPAVEYATISGDGADGLNETYYVLIRFTATGDIFVNMRVNVLHLATQ
jgi:hypothetical protein